MILVWVHSTLLIPTIIVSWVTYRVQRRGRSWLEETGVDQTRTSFVRRSVYSMIQHRAVFSFPIMVVTRLSYGYWVRRVGHWSPAQMLWQGCHRLPLATRLVSILIRWVMFMSRIQEIIASSCFCLDNATGPLLPGSVVSRVVMHRYWTFQCGFHSTNKWICMSPILAITEYWHLLATDWSLTKVMRVFLFLSGSVLSGGECRSWIFIIQWQRKHREKGGDDVCRDLRDWFYISRANT